jgi:hypothetical protein
MKNPYQHLPQAAFWRSAVAERQPRTISHLWDAKHQIEKSDRVTTFGSCFAQHISRSLVARNYNWLDAEKARNGTAQGLGIFSARTGNIYTAAALRQWVEWAIGERPPPEEIWEKDGRYFDPFRPAIEPLGFASPEDLRNDRNITLRALRDVVEQADHFVFTLGLTEAWTNRAGYTYSVCPGTAAGEFDPAEHSFKNFEYPEILADMQAVADMLRQVSPGIRMLLTVSPVPLTATASGQHVLVATTYSKSVLRAVAGHLSDTHDWIDYFPSYEIITAPPFRGQFYEDNQRSVTPEGVAFVMQCLFDCLHRKFGTEPSSVDAGAGAGAGETRRRHPVPEADVVCEEIMLDAFAPAAQATTSAPRADAKRLCIIGNSHIGALRMAIKSEDFVDPGLDVVLWGFPGQSFKEVEFENGRLTHPNTQMALRISGGRHESIDPNEFDALAFVGGFQPGSMLAAFAEQGTLNEQRMKGWLRRNFVKKGHALALALEVVKNASCHVLLLPSPFVSELSGERAKIKVEESDLERFNHMARAAFAEKRITYVPQPAETIRDGKWTAREYSLKNNHSHANQDYGAIVLAAIRDHLNGSGGQRQAIKDAAGS